MPDLISKLQYKNYERGEFSHECKRSLQETIQLIKDFPWETQRIHTDIQATGPSVTVQNDRGEYLKVGLYFNDKYCLYLFDRYGHVLEFHTPDLDSVCRLVEDFYNGCLDATKFEKQVFVVAGRGHFATNDFIYKASVWRMLALSWPFIAYFLMFVYFLILSPFEIAWIPALFVLPIAWLLARIFVRYLHYRKCFLQVSNANNIFKFGIAPHIKTYDKRDIEKIISYMPGGNRNPNLFCVFEICFKSGEIIKVSNLIISSTTFLGKFEGINFEDGKRNSLRVL
ncbi:hypothetical protein [Mucilaginibacter pedocola]|uniref:PH domain-containing protein n=1 Tax=Mucilaginibacter pedocola TaxID=1792845 RepID=A0A1S9PIP8_9SPHI|nr:hypothetical protein [Mucilaginibacter pedocola]OOQ60823.1 hypothetical protein BC343_22915 [Mucilaginibacter pedocola]